MKPLIISLVVLVIASTCCIPGVLTPTPTNSPPVEPPVTEPPVTEPPIVITEAPLVITPPAIAGITCDILSMDLDPGLAGGYSCEVEPEDAEYLLLPEYAYYTLDGYVFAYEFFAASIFVLPVARYLELDPAVSGSLAELQGLIAGSAPGSTLPYLPPPPAHQAFIAQYQTLSFTNGEGIRFLTQYIQNQAPVYNDSIKYIYQGLTSDGNYWISVSLPVSHSSLQAHNDTPPGGQTWDQFYAGYPSYIAGVKAQLDSYAASSFQPALTALDELISSITILP